MAPDIRRQQEIDQKRSYWNEHITSWQSSGLSQTEYCHCHNLKYHQFVYWRQKYGPKPAESVSLVQVPAAAVGLATGCSPRPPALRVALASDLCIEVSPGFDPLTLQQVVLALRGLR